MLLSLAIVVASLAEAAAHTSLEFSVPRGAWWQGSVRATIVRPERKATGIAVVAHCTLCWGDWYPHLEELSDTHDLMMVFLHSDVIDSPRHFFDFSNGAPHTWFSGYGEDMTKVLHAVRDSANEFGSELYGTLLPVAPAVAVGHSLGGAGSLIATSRDEDFEGAFVMSPCVVHSETLASISKPIMVLSATEDGICPPARTARPYYAALSRAPELYYAEIVGGTHCAFMDVSGTNWEAGAQLGVAEAAGGACRLAERGVGLLLGAPPPAETLDNDAQRVTTARLAGLFFDALLGTAAERRGAGAGGGLGPCPTEKPLSESAPCPPAGSGRGALLAALAADEAAGLLSNVQSALGAREESPAPEGAHLASQNYLALLQECLCV